MYRTCAGFSCTERGWKTRFFTTAIWLNPGEIHNRSAKSIQYCTTKLKRCEEMPSTVINLYYLKINSISGNGSITIGEAAYNSPTTNNKSQGLNSSFGDTSPIESMMENLLNDPDVNDQTAIGTADTANITPVPPIID